MRTFPAILVLVSAVLPGPAWAWGGYGHETVADIASDRLTPKARAAVAALLQPNASMAAVSSWADEERSFDRATGPWHYIDLPVRRDITAADEPRYCPQGGCVVEEIDRDIGILKDPQRDRPSKRIALEYLIHFVGDLHQPLHCADDDDQGGNRKRVVFQAPDGRTEALPLHALWDELVGVERGADPRALATRLETQITPSETAAWSRGSASDWAFESYTVAKTDIYPGLSEGPTRGRPIALPADYGRTMAPIVEQQLERAGVRLGFILDDLFG